MDYTMRGSSYLLPRISRVKSHWRHTPEGKLTYVSEYTALRYISEDILHPSEGKHAPISSEEEFLSNAREIFKNFNELVQHYSAHKDELSQHIQRCFPSASAEHIASMLDEDHMPLTLFYLAPLLPEEHRAVVDRAMSMFAAQTVNTAILRAWRDFPDIDEVTRQPWMEEIDELQLMGAEINALWHELPAALNPLCYSRLQSAANIVTLRDQLGASPNPEVQQQAERVFKLVPMLLFADMVGCGISYGCGIPFSYYYCHYGVEALIGMLEATIPRFFALIPSSEKPRRHILEAVYDAVAEMAMTYAQTFGQAAQCMVAAQRKRETADDATDQAVIFANTLAKFAHYLSQSKDLNISFAEESNEDELQHCIGQLSHHLARSFVESTVECFMQHEDMPPDDRMSEAHAFLERDRERLLSIASWYASIHALAHESDIVKRTQECAHTNVLVDEIISHAMNDFMAQMRENFGRSLDDAINILKACIAYKIGREDARVWRNFISPILQTVERQCREYLEQTGRIAPTEEEVRKAHPTLCQLFGNQDAAVRDVMLPPAYKDRISALADAFTRALSVLVQLTPPTISLPEELVSVATSSAIPQVVQRTTNVMMSIITEAERTRMESVAVSDLVEETLKRMFTTELPEGVSWEDVNEMQQRWAEVQAVLAVKQTRKRLARELKREPTDAEIREKVGEEIWTHYHRSNLSDADITRLLNVKKAYESARRATIERIIGVIKAVEPLRIKREKIRQLMRQLKRQQQKEEATERKILPVVNEQGEVDFARFVACYGYYGGVLVAEGITPSEAYTQLRERLHLRERPAKLVVSWHLDAFAQLGRYCPDHGSCYRDGRSRQYDKWVLARSANKEGYETFVATLHLPTRATEERQHGPCIARLWGAFRPAVEEGKQVYHLYLTNIDDSNNEAFRETLMRGTVDLFAQRLKAKVSKVAYVKRIGTFAAVWQDGDGVHYTLQPQSEQSS